MIYSSQLCTSNYTLWEPVQLWIELLTESVHDTCCFLQNFTPYLCGGVPLSLSRLPLNLLDSTKMATVIWMAVFMLLMVELVIAAILVLPLPRFLRKFIARTIFAYDLGRRVRFISNFIILGLVLAVSDAVNTIRHLELKDEAADSSGSYGDRGAGFVNASFDKQRKFRAERNVR